MVEIPEKKRDSEKESEKYLLELTYEQVVSILQILDIAVKYHENQGAPEDAAIHLTRDVLLHIMIPSPQFKYKWETLKIYQKVFKQNS